MRLCYHAYLMLRNHYFYRKYANVVSIRIYQQLFCSPANTNPTRRHRL